MNYIVVYRKEGVINSLFFSYRDESNVAFKEETLIRDEDDVIRIMLEYFHPDNGDMAIRETLLDVNSYKEDNIAIIKVLEKLLDE